MATVKESFDTLLRQFRANQLGYRGSERLLDYLEDGIVTVTIQYEITGEDGGMWNALVNLQDATCKITEGPASNPHATVQMSAQDWLDLMSGKQSVSALLSSNRLMVMGDADAMGIILDLPYLGLLGPPVDTVQRPYPRWLWLHGFPKHPWRLDTFMLGRELDYYRFRYLGKFSWQIGINEISPITLLAILWSRKYRRLAFPTAAAHFCLRLVGLTLILSVFPIGYVAGWRYALMTLPWIIVARVVWATVRFRYSFASRETRLASLRRAEARLVQKANVDPHFFEFAIKTGLLTLNPMGK